jgi:hypothetical protein
MRDIFSDADDNQATADIAPRRRRRIGCSLPDNLSDRLGRRSQFAAGRARRNVGVLWGSVPRASRRTSDLRVRVQVEPEVALTSAFHPLQTFGGGLNAANG